MSRKNFIKIGFVLTLALMSLQNWAVVVLAQAATPVPVTHTTHNPAADISQGFHENEGAIFFIALILGVGGYIFGQATGHAGTGIAILFAVAISTLLVAFYPMYSGALFAYGSS